MIKESKQGYVLENNHICYVFGITKTGHLEHFYFGKRIKGMADEDFFKAMTEKKEFPQGNVNAYTKEDAAFSLEDVRLEMSSYGKGDLREPFVVVEHEDGSSTSDFLFESARILEEKPEADSLPVATGYILAMEKENAMQNVTQTLEVTLRDASYDLVLKLYYTIYEDCDVITRRSVLVNESQETITIKRLLSNQLDFDENGYVFTTFHGAWAREMEKHEQQIFAGQVVNSTVAGCSSSRANPFVMIHKKETTENYGECIGCNLVYSGNHYASLEVNSFGKNRFVSGINPALFSYLLKPGEKFEAPEAVMAYSKEGFCGMSQNMHQFVREHVVRGEWAKKTRPVLLNSWEAAYFDINEKKLLALAKAGKEVGIELFVMDDGWFGERNDDKSSLGDWDVNEKKLPGGLAGLANKIETMGLKFGIWVEPEMVNEKSKLYEVHPEWVIKIPGKPHAEGRNQMILDLTNEDVRNYIIEKMTVVFSSANIRYVKWDMNRIFSDYYSQSLPGDRQGEVGHRYICGLYQILKVLTQRFPHILFEGCAAGGNRFDLGMLCYFPQIWGSDNTDALCRAKIQNSYSYGYPLSVVGAHVSSVPNHQTLRRTPLETRFGVASFGILGYECNFCDMGKEELEAVKKQIALYKEWREVLQKGTFYRSTSFENGGNLLQWTCVSKDKKKAVGFIMQKLVEPNTVTHIYKACGLDEDKRYHFYNRELKYNVKEFGDLVNTVSPIHIKQDSLTHNLIAKFVKMDGEKEDYILSGSLLMNAGVHLKQAFGATGYNEETRYFPDFASRLYFMEEIEE